MTDIGASLQRAGHHLSRADPLYPTRYALAILARWFADVAEDAAGLDCRRLERRTRTHVRTGQLARRPGRVDARDRENWRRIVGDFFSRYDLLVTPALATLPIGAGPGSRRSWLVNLWANANYAPFASPWNLAGFPAACVPAGRYSDGTPLGIQLVAAESQEALILGVSQQLEHLCPWPRRAPLAASPARPPDQNSERESPIRDQMPETAFAPPIWIGDSPPRAGPSRARSAHPACASRRPEVAPAARPAFGLEPCSRGRTAA